MDEQRSRIASGKPPAGRADGGRPPLEAPDGPTLWVPSPSTGSVQIPPSPEDLDAAPSLWVAPPLHSDPPHYDGHDAGGYETPVEEEHAAGAPDGSPDPDDPSGEWERGDRSWQDRWRAALPGTVVAAVVVISFSLVLAASPRHQTSRLASGRPVPATAMTTTVPSSGAPTAPPSSEAPAAPEPPAEPAATAATAATGQAAASHSPGSVAAPAPRQVTPSTTNTAQPVAPQAVPSEPAANTTDTVTPAAPPATAAPAPVDTTTAPSTTTTTADPEGDDGPPAGCTYFPDLPGC